MAINTFKQYVTKINEGFLDDDNEEALTADKFTDVKEDDKEKPFPEHDDDELSLDGPNDDNDVDLSDEIGSVEAEDDKTEKEDLADLKLDELSDDDDVEDSGDKKAEEKKAEQETAERATDTMDQLKDAIATLTTKIEALTDKVDNSSESSDSTENGDELSGDLNTDLSDDLSNDELNGNEPNGENADEFGNEEGSAEDSEGNEEGSSENTESNDNGESSEEDANEGSDEDFGEDESDNTKSEAYNYYMKKGKLLNSNSGSLIGKAVNEKLYDLDEDFMNIVKAKIRKLIEAKKLELRNKNF